MTELKKEIIELIEELEPDKIEIIKSFIEGLIRK